MRAKLEIYPVSEICDGFRYSKLEEKGLFGLSGNLTIQPEYQRHYIYATEGKGEKEKDVIHSVLREYPLGLIYFNQVGTDKFEVLDGQQRITSLGRFINGDFAIKDEDGHEQYFGAMAEDKKDLILKTKLLVYICEGSETEIKDWFQTINIAGVKLETQEKLNAIYWGEFVTLGKQEFSNSRNSNIQKWSAYISGTVNRQDYWERALEWVSDWVADDESRRQLNKTEKIERYMSRNRHNTNIDEVKNHFNAVIDWISNTFSDVKKEMQGLEWGRLYREYHKTKYNPAKVSNLVEKYYNDPYIGKTSGIFEYILGGETNTQLLQVRIFDKAIKREVYKQQTDEAKPKGESNCPLCVIENKTNKDRIWSAKDMEADHVTAWAKGGGSDISNCQMLCITHNRTKGNR